MCGNASKVTFFLPIDYCASLNGLVKLRGFSKASGNFPIFSTAVRDTSLNK